MNDYTQFDLRQVEKLSKLIDKLNATSLPELLSSMAKKDDIIAVLARIGLDRLLSEKPELRNSSSRSPAYEPYDPLLRPSQAAAELGFGWAHMRNTLMAKYNIKSTGTGKSRRFRRSEINRVKELMIGSGLEELPDPTLISDD